MKVRFLPALILLCIFVSTAVKSTAVLCVLIRMVIILDHMLGVGGVITDFRSVSFIDPASLMLATNKDERLTLRQEVAPGWFEFGLCFSERSIVTKTISQTNQSSGGETLSSSRCKKRNQNVVDKMSKLFISFSRKHVRKLDPGDTKLLADVRRFRRSLGMTLPTAPLVGRSAVPRYL